MTFERSKSNLGDQTPGIST